METYKLNILLMENNITLEDRENLIEFLKEDHVLTQSKNVIAFEQEWSKWLGIKYSVFVNSGASANLLTMSVLKFLYGEGEIIVPTLTWVSDIASVIQNGFKPIFVDVDPKTLSMNDEEVLSKITKNTKAVFLTHVLGLNGLTHKLLNELERRKIPLIEDACEAHGVTFQNKKVGTFGFISNFSFYYAHHMSTIEGGMICTQDEKIYHILRMLRSHGMVRECGSDTLRESYVKEFPDLNPDFIFAYPSYNVRSTELNAMIGLSQLKRLDENNQKRTENFKLFLNLLDPKKYRTDFNLEGSVNYAFILVLTKPNDHYRDAVMKTLREANVEFRRGLSGGGNQLRQPYLKKYLFNIDLKNFPEIEHLHFYSFYIGNYPDLPKEKIIKLCQLLNSI